MPHQQKILKKVTDLEKYEKSWRIDKHIPIALLFGLAIQAAGFIWYAAQMDSRVTNLEARRVQDDADTRNLVREIIDMKGEIIRVRTMLEVQMMKNKTEPKP